MASKRLRSWFFTVTSVLRLDGTTGGVRFRTKDKPTQGTMEDLTASVPFFTETDSKAKVSASGSIESEQGLVVLATDTQAKANASQLTDRSLVIQPHQLPTAEVIAASSTEDMPTTTLTIDTGAASTRNQYRFRLASTWINWLITRIIPQGGTTGQVLIKQSSTNYHTAWGQLANDSTFITALQNNTTFINNLTTQIITNNPAAITDGLEVGFMRLWPSTSLPTAKWLRMDGSAISRTTYSGLFSLIGTTYGVGDGSTTFNLPDFRDKQATGYSGSKTIGSTGGAESRTITANNLPTHTHSLNTTSHHHSFYYSVLTGLGGAGVNGVNTITTTDPGGGTLVDTTDVGGSGTDTGNNTTTATALTTIDPYLAVNMIIKVLP